VKEKWTKKKSSKFIFAFVIVLGISGYLAGKFTQSQRESLPFPENGLVTAVYDGDTIKVKFKSGLEKVVRLIGIDSPETDAVREKIKFRAYMAKRFAFFYLYSRKIKLSYDWELEDKYNRLLAYIWTEKEGLFNKYILSEGFAAAFLNFPFKYKKEFIEAEGKARRSGKGLWKSEPYPSISPHETMLHIGRLLSVKYRCEKVSARGKYVFLRSSGEFSTLIPKTNIYLLHEQKSFEGKIMLVKGFLETYKGKPQMVAFFPSQITLIERVRQ